MLSIYESYLVEVKNRVSEVSDEETRRAVKSIVELLKLMAKDLSDVKALTSPRTC